MDDRRAALRAQLRVLHPDVGGDPARFQKVLDEYHALYGTSPEPRDYRGEVRFAARPRRIQRMLRRLSRRGGTGSRVH